MGDQEGEVEERFEGGLVQVSSHRESRVVWRFKGGG